MLLRYLGAGPHLDAFKQALRSGNLIQNLLGEQTLSAAFIPGYSRMLEEEREEEAGRFAGAVFGLLLAVAGVLTLIGVLGAPLIVTIFNPGYLRDAAAVAAGELSVDRFPLAVRLVRWLFPMAGLLVLSAWSVGVLNSHRRFFVAYFAPVAWNAAIIAALWLAGSHLAVPTGGSSATTLALLERLLVAGAVGALVGGALQFLVQLPSVVAVLRGFRLSLSTRVSGVRQALAAFWPMLAGRGAVQLSGHLDGFIASFLAAGAQGILLSALTLYLLPLSLFGLAVAAAELPEMSREERDSPRASERLSSTVRRSAFLVVPTAVGYIAFGLLIIAGIFGHGRFGPVDRWLLYLVLATYSFGLPASGITRQLNTLFYARGETRVPARVGVERVLLSAGIGAVLAFGLDQYEVAGVVGLEQDEPLYLGAVGLAAGGALGAWYELFRIRRRLAERIGSLRLPGSEILRMGGAAVLSIPAGAAVWFWVARMLPTWLGASLVVAVYAGAYLVLARGFGVSELGPWLDGMPWRRKG